MGNADSKVAAAAVAAAAEKGESGAAGAGANDTAASGGGGGQQQVVEDIPSKESNYTGYTFFDESEFSREATMDEKKEVDHTASTVRRTPKKKGGKKKMGRGGGDHGGNVGPGPHGGGGGGGGESIASSHITEDQVHVNLAMADLMAYLQVVANNSNHLPLTRRDDPELDRTVSTLTSEDYARKSAAFIPSDVRVIGGTFTRYGRVWDLPTSEEYNACDGAHEPGRSYGGACANAMLKVLYDAANDVVDAAQTEAAAASLFEDDDEESEDVGSTTMSRSFKSGFSLEFTSPNPTTMTWAQLLRKMKAEIKEIEYAQIPKITTTRKIDLNKPFSLVPDNFDATKGKKRSLLIGCNYKNIPGAELKASHDDVRSVKDYIVNVHGFPEVKGLMTVLLDDEDHKHPTFLNITEAFKVLSEESQPGDAVFVQFSGHGGRILDAPMDEEAESYDETIVPSDYQVSGLIRDTLIFKTLLAPMRYGVTVTLLLDCCDTGVVLELPYSWSTKSDRRDHLAKLVVNEDFSFVRFLKVVKTLYESSTFTQLGRTVGSALNPEAEKFKTAVEKTNGDRDSVARENSFTDVSADNQNIFDAISRACALSSKVSRDEKEKSCRKKNGKTEGKESLLETMMNSCSAFVSPENDEDILTDEEIETFQTHTEDAYSYDDTMTDGAGEGGSFETLTDEEEYEERRGRSRSRRGRG